MKNMVITSFLLSAAICIGTAAFAAPPLRHGVGRGRSPVTAQEAAEVKKANEKSKRRIAPYLTDEGSSGRLTWKEYTVNPKAKGEATLLVVFGGRDSVKDGRGEAKIPVAIEKAISHASLLPRSGRLIVLVPDMMVGESRRGRGGRETPVSEGMPKLVRSRMEKHGVKAERTFATGFSMGGGLVYSLLNDDPTLFARALVVGASGNPNATKDIRAEILDYHGADDDYIPAVRVKAFAEAVNAKTPGRMRLETLDKTGHAESETAAYSKNDAWKWLFR